MPALPQVRASFRKEAAMAEKPLVGIIMGSKSDMPAMEACTAELEELGVPY